MRILELGAGRDWVRWKDHDDCEVVCVDQLYEFVDIDTGDESIELIGSNIIEFLEGYVGPSFEKVVATRVFEHFDRETIGYALYLLRQITTSDAILEIIVPDIVKVIEEFNHINPYTDSVHDFNSSMIRTHTEVFNELNDPHRSLWNRVIR